jgi:hypothetical protein
MDERRHDRHRLLQRRRRSRDPRVGRRRFQRECRVGNPWLGQPVDRGQFPTDDLTDRTTLDGSPDDASRAGRRPER